MAMSSQLSNDTIRRCSFLLSTSSQWYDSFAGLYLQVCKYGAIFKSLVATTSHFLDSVAKGFCIKMWKQAWSYMNWQYLRLQWFSKLPCNYRLVNIQACKTFIELATASIQTTDGKRDLSERDRQTDRENRGAFKPDSSGMWTHRRDSMSAVRPLSSLHL